MRLTIKNASVQEEAIATDQSLENLFYKETSSIYHANMRIEIEVFDRNQSIIRVINIDGEHTLPEYSSLRDRKNLWYIIGNDFSNSFNKGMEDILLSDPAFAHLIE